MRYSFTAAAERALVEATAWSIGEFSDALEAPAVLLGLLSEPECRAAITLGGLGIDAAAIRSRWPSLVRLPLRVAAWGINSPASGDLSGATAVRTIAPEVAESFARVVRRLRRLGLPEELGTEHLLWGLAIVDGEVSEWLQQQGVESEKVEADIYRIHGLPPIDAEGTPSEPLPFDAEEANDETSEETIRQASEKTSAAASCARDADQAFAPEAETVWLPERLAVLRVIDAAANRAREGLRVAEDYVRFILEDAALTSQLKGLRHELTALLGRFPFHERLVARDTLGDVGTQLSTDGELRRESPASVLAANFTRLQESLRSLEEFAKIVDPTAASALERMRYRSYTLHRAAAIWRACDERLSRAQLYVLIDGRSTAEAFAELAQSIVAAGAHVVQLRDKRLDDRALLERARTLRRITADAGALFIMNDRPDLAVLSHADGVHVGQEELSVKDARSIVGPKALIGVSTHSIEQARSAVLEGANYLGVGPVFPSQTKQFTSFPGVELLRAAAREIRVPAFAIGGISLHNLPLVLETGFSRVAVGAAIANAASPQAAVQAFLNALG